MIIIKKIFSQIKDYWQLLIGLAIGIIGAAAVSKKSNDEKISEIKEIADEKKEKIIEEALEQQIEAKQEVEEEYEKTIKAVEKWYVSQGTGLRQSKKEYIKEIHEKLNDDPEQIKNLIMKEFGVKLRNETQDD